MHHVTMHVSQPKVSAGKTIGQAFMVQPQQVQHRGVDHFQVVFTLPSELALLILLLSGLTPRQRPAHDLSSWQLKLNQLRHRASPRG